MKEFLITIIAPEKEKLSPSDETRCIADYGKWATELGEIHVFARRLALTKGALLPKNESIITDGPYTEGKELIAGIILIKAKDLTEASAIAKTCPLNSYFHLFVKESQ